MAKKWGLVAALVLLVALFFFSGAAQFLDLSSLKALRGEFAQWQLAHPGLFLAAFFLCYVAVTALSLPGAVILTLGAGAFFGLFQGFLVASFASTLGACCAFLCARFIARDWVAQRFSSSLKKIDQGIAREGALYLFSLRLVPLFPFFLINLVMGLTNMPLRRFYWVSQLGMVPGTLVYVNAGRSLSEIDGLSGILSPGLIASFVMLGIFPLLAKRIVEALKRHRVYKGWSRPQRFDRNLLVIGGGAAGLVSAYIAATVRAKVTLVEAGAMGGDCLNTGCVPSKALIKAASVVHQYRRAERYGLQVGGSVDLPRVMERVRRAIADIEPHDSVERYTGLGVDVVQGYARLVDPWTVEIRRQNGELQRLTAASVVIASGAEPVVPPLPGLETAPFVTSETLWQRLESYAKAPERVVVLGGGPIGCELSQALQR
ncbi:MAG: VTT domain-containing protein, partial [Spongiibacter sp.]|nr:VTT domain-containing protein [Spongiibacter sp.]